MKATVNQQDLLRASNRTHSIVEAGGPYEIEEYVLIEASEDLVSLRSVAAETDIVAIAPAEVAEPGSVVVKSGLLNQIARRIVPDVPVKLSTADEDEDNGASNRLRVDAADSHFALDMRSPQEFPQRPEDTYDSTYPLPGKDLVLLLEKTFRAISHEETRYYLTGVYLHSVEEKGGPRLASVATDGHRLMKATIPVGKSAANAPGVILPERSVNALRRNIDGVEEIEISVATNKIRFAAKSFALISPVIDGKYPDYPRVIPTDNNIPVEIEVRALNNCLARVTAISDTSHDRVIISLSEGKAELSVRTFSGHSRDSIPVAYTGRDMHFALFATHLRDVLSQVQGELLSMTIRDERSAFLVTEQIEEADLAYVMVPHRT